MTQSILTKLARIIPLCCASMLAPCAAQSSDLEQGKALAKAKGCPQCHGLSGNTGYETDPPTPKLAGQPKAYLIKAMKDYRSGNRKMEVMNTLMGPRSDDEIALLAAYFSAQKRY